MELPPSLGNSDHVTAVRRLLLSHECHLSHSSLAKLKIAFCTGIKQQDDCPKNSLAENSQFLGAVEEQNGQYTRNFLLYKPC